MGSGYHDADQTITRVSRARAGGQSVMGHSAAIDRGLTPRNAHPKLDPKRKSRGQPIIRESRDSVDHPTSNPIAVFFDTTGSMGAIPGLLVEKLGNLMKLLNERKYITDPQVLFGAINDAGNGSVVPLEVGQFESSNEMDDVVTNIWSSQSGGGGNSKESYELAFYFMAKKAALDSLEKRGKKGYFFIIGDEAPYDTVSQADVKEFIGDDLGEDIPIKTILAELRTKFEVFWILPNTSTSKETGIVNKLNELFGERILRLQEPSEICELIAATIAVNEGQDARQVMKDLRDNGSNNAAAKRALDAAVAAIPDRNIVLGDL